MVNFFEALLILNFDEIDWKYQKYDTESWVFFKLILVIFLKLASDIKDKSLRNILNPNHVIKMAFLW